MNIDFDIAFRRKIVVRSGKIRCSGSTKNNQRADIGNFLASRVGYNSALSHALLYHWFVFFSAHQFFDRFIDAAFFCDIIKKQKKSFYAKQCDLILKNVV